MVTPKPAAAKPPIRKTPAKKAAAPVKKTAAKPISKQQKDLLPDLEDNTTYKKAEVALQAAGLSLGQVLQELIPNEVDEENLIHLPVRPSIRQVSLDKIVVVMVEYDADYSTEYSKPIDRDSEGFDDLDEAKAYYDINVQFAKGDVQGVEAARHIVVMFKDTEDLMDFTYDVIVPDRDAEAKVWKEGAEALLDDQQHDFIFSGKADVVAARLNTFRTAKAVAKGDLKVKGLKRSANAPGKTPADKAKKPPVKSSVAPPKPKVVKNPPPAKRTAEDLTAELKASRERRGVDRTGRIIQKQEAEKPTVKAAARKPKPQPAIAAKKLPVAKKAATPKAAPIKKASA